MATTLMEEDDSDMDFPDNSVIGSRKGNQSDTSAKPSVEDHYSDMDMSDDGSG
ncbi:hypothetical protein FS837_005378 [Tulasnella sp. UAMH 9824]|nr:hypothetical protein FS837_005378 [Tulasnella sp. UAMH 9824]